MVLGAALGVGVKLAGTCTGAPSYMMGNVSGRRPSTLRLMAKSGVMLGRGEPLLSPEQIQ